jgi:glycosyltransferase involved in cell wall biosynthesis
VAQLLCSGSFAGAESVACSLTRALQPMVARSVLYLVQELRSGAEVCARLVERARSFDIEVRVLATEERFSWALLRQLQAAFAEDAIDVAHSHSYKAAFYSPAIRQMDRGLIRSTLGATLFTIHGLEHQSLRGRLFEQGVVGMGALLNDALIGVSEAIANSVRRVPLLGRRVHAIPNAIIAGNSEPLQQVRSKRDAVRAKLAAAHRLDPALPWVALVGRLVPVKNHALFLEAIAALSAEDSKAEFLIIGDGPERASIEAAINERDLGGRVRLLGHVDDIDSVYGSADLLVLTSDSEGSPMVLLEGMSFGVPLASSAVGGVPDLLRHERNGLLFAPGNAAACAAALQRLLGDAALRQRLGDAGYELAQTEFHHRRWAERHLQLYRSLLAR